ncbi:MAG: hypothetical protein IKV18_07480, partial [Alistipes sp.]|nr:hypothetical protein [Alistipes sp.]
MKTFRLVSAALLAVLMCANFVSCSKDDDGANTDVGGGEEGGNEEVIVSEKKLVKMVSNEETYTFSYDNEGRLSSAIDTYSYDDGSYSEQSKYSYKFIGGDDAVMVKYEYERESDYIYGGTDTDTGTDTYTYSLKDGLVQSYVDDDNDKGTYSYNNSNRLIKA